MKVLVLVISFFFAGASTLSNDFEEGSMGQWFDLSSSGVAWNMQSFSELGNDSIIPKPPTGDRFLLATSNAESGVAALCSSVFTALPGEFFRFALWTDSLDINFQVYWTQEGNEYPLLNTSELSKSATKGWGAYLIQLPFDLPENISLAFYGYFANNSGSVLALDDISVGAANNQTSRVPFKNQASLISPRLTRVDHLYYQGYFSTEGFPNNYPNNYEHYWYLDSQGSGLIITFHPFYTENYYDEIKIYIGWDDWIPFFTTSGYYSYLTIYLLDNQSLVYFKSDYFNTDVGFAADFGPNVPSTTTPITTTSPTTTSSKTTEAHSGTSIAFGFPATLRAITAALGLLFVTAMHVNIS